MYRPFRIPAGLLQKASRAGQLVGSLGLARSHPFNLPVISLRRIQFTLFTFFFLRVSSTTIVSVPSFFRLRSFVVIAPSWVIAKDNQTLSPFPPTLSDIADVHHTLCRFRKPCFSVVYMAAPKCKNCVPLSRAKSELSGKIA